MADPLNCRPRLGRAAAEPELASPDPARAARAAAALAVAVGRCTLCGVTDPLAVLPPDRARPAAEGLTGRMTRAAAAADADRLPDRFDASDPADFALVAADLLTSRMDGWAGFVAVDDAYQARLAAGDPAADLGPAVSALADALDRFDDALRPHADLLAVAADTYLLDNWRAALAPEFAEVPPWWLDGTLEAALRAVKGKVR